jgi:hypothetical protein
MADIATQQKVSLTTVNCCCSSLGLDDFIIEIIELIHSFIPLGCAECDDSLPFSGASIPVCYILFPATLLYQLFFRPPSLHLAIYFFIYLVVLLIPNSYTILVWEFYFLPFSVHVQTNIIYVTLLSLLWWVF